jgi:uncharacterized protein
MSNRLSLTTSPYLLQHANNPVDWYPWGEAAWSKAKEEKKLVLVSIGYSACHWCHVMEREVFENHLAAERMNTHFISIKVDREERPDVDQLYLASVQLMNGQGGWPLNVFCLPDGRPVFGGTYFPFDRWLSVLDRLIDIQEREPGRLEEYASQLKEGIRRSDFVLPAERGSLDESLVRQIVEKWRLHWDRVLGGFGKAPKFPMPVNLDFLLHYGILDDDDAALDFVRVTLDHMSNGGICDQVGGGFARYSVDDRWKVPHFEKMLYDNAQLVKLYGQAARAFDNPKYLLVMEEILEWVSNELTSPDGLFYAALDADSEGEEGKFYTWTESEIREVLGEDAEMAMHYFSVGTEGVWEMDQNILLVKADDQTFAAIHDMQPTEWQEKRRLIRNKMRSARNARVRPGLDDKVITSWNALMIQGYTEAYKTTGKPVFLESACLAARSLQTKVWVDQRLYRQYTKEHASIAGFLDDYAFVIEAWLGLYEVTSDERWLFDANSLLLGVMDRFTDDATGLFWYTPDDGEQLFARQKELADNVIPSANSSLCRSLFIIGHYLDKPHYIERSRSMLGAVLPLISYGGAWSNWLKTLLYFTRPFREIVVCGPDADRIQAEWNKTLIPNAVFCASTIERSLPLLSGRYGKETPIYVCTGPMCHAPVYKWEKAKEFL